jgi:hypothetical protein
MSKDKFQEDLIAKGFHKLDDNLIEKRPPKINWGELYKKFNDSEKIAYLEKLASTMNHAAYLIQEERNELGKLCELKENQIQQLKKAMEQNNEMLTSEITRMNSDRQRFNQAIINLKKELRDFKKQMEKE